jgi:hypothetical protein
MCHECDKLDAEFSGAKFDPEEDGETSVYRGIVLSRAFEIVQHELWVTSGKMGRLLHCASSQVSRLKEGRPMRERTFFQNLAQLEEARATGRRRTNVVARLQRPTEISL